MKKITYLFMIITLLLACDTKQESNNSEHQDLVKFWNTFKSAMKDNDMNFLSKNSYSKIQCGNCGIEPDSIEWFTAKEFYKTHIKKIMPPSREDYSVSLDNQNENILASKAEKLYRINYAMEAEEKYNIIYTVKKYDGQFKFEGMFTVP